MRTVLPAEIVQLKEVGQSFKSTLRRCLWETHISFSRLVTDCYHLTRRLENNAHEGYARTIGYSKSVILWGE